MADLQLAIRLTVENGQFKIALVDAQGQIQKLGSGGLAAGQQMESGFGRARQGVQSISRQLDSARTALLGFFAFQQLRQFTGGVIALADTYRNGEARLRLFTKSQDEFNVAQAATFEIAQRTRTGLQDTINLYGRVTESVRTLGGNQAQTLAITEAVNQSLQISGAGTAQQAAAITQFSQALAGGILRAEEFNSIIENSPRLAQALADGLDVPRGALRALVNEGKVSSEQIVAALLDQRAILEREFASLPLTVSGALTQIRNAFQQQIGDVDASIGGTKVLAESLSAVASNLRQALDAVYRGIVLVATAAGVQLLASLQAGANALLLQRAAAQQAALGQAQHTAALVTGLQAQVVKTAADLSAIRAELNHAVSLEALARAEYAGAIAGLRSAQSQDAKVAAYTRAAVGQAQLTRTQASLTAVTDATTKAQQASTAASDGLEAALGTQRTGMIASIRQMGLLRAGLNGLLAAGQLVGAFFIGWNVGKYLVENFEPARLAGSFLAQGFVELIEAGKLLEEASKSFLSADTLEASFDRYQARITAARELFAQQRQDIRAGLDQPPGKANAGAPGSLDVDLKGTGGIDLEGAEGATAARKKEMDAFLRDLEDRADAFGAAQQLKRDINVQTLAAEGRDTDAALARLQAQYEEHLATLRAAGENTELATKLFDLGKAKIATDAIKAEVEKLISDLNERVSIRDRRSQFSRPLERDRLQDENAADVLDTQAQIDAVARQPGADGDAASAFIERAREGLRGLSEDISRATEGPIAQLFREFTDGTAAMEAAAASWISSTVDGIAELVSTGKADFKGLADSIIKDIIRIQLRAAVAGLVGSIFPSFAGFGGAAGGGGVPASFTGGGFGNGAGLSGNAEGGFISGPGGPTDDKIPARLSNGEYVIKAASVQRFGRSFFDALNGGFAPRGAQGFAEGGFVGRASSPASSSSGAPTVQIINQGRPVSVSRTEQGRNPDGSSLLRVFIAAASGDISRNGPLAQTMQAIYDLPRKAF